MYGFIIAVFWIDRIANELVALLEFFGVVWGIQSSVLGLTVLAWGNSVGDLVTDVAMAKRGLSNMAITACFAGPVFNMLMGMGIGMMGWRDELWRDGRVGGGVDAKPQPPHDMQYHRLLVHALLSTPTPLPHSQVFWRTSEITMCTRLQCPSHPQWCPALR